MKRATPIAALLLASGLAMTSAQAQPSSEQEKIRRIVIYGTDPCPPSTADEIIVCSRRPETERLRIPPNLREAPPSPDSESQTEKVERLEMLGRTGINSCSAVGPGGGTGCLEQLIRQAREEREAMAKEHGKAP